MNEFEANNEEILLLINEWESVLWVLTEEMTCNKRNKQNRNVKQILGHMVDSASNNTHRIVHLQYQKSPLVFPDYANFGNNDKWIAIQNYSTENWGDLIQLWKYTNLHFVHVVRNINADKLANEWLNGAGEVVNLRDMIHDYVRHFKLHLNEINELIGS